MLHINDNYIPNPDFVPPKISHGDPYPKKDHYFSIGRENIHSFIFIDN